jgi:hypothetical protein
VKPAGISGIKRGNISKGGKIMSLQRAIRTTDIFTEE